MEKTADLSKKAKYKVPFGTVSLPQKAVDLINQALQSQWVTRGKYVSEFEEKFAAVFGAKHAISVSSGTDADAICCAALYDYGAERGDEVIIPALTFIATGNAVLQAGLKPVFVDIRRETLNIDPEKIEAAITPKTRAIMPVHLMGKPADMDTILALAKKHNLKVIEDCAHAIETTYKGKHVGLIGDIGNLYRLIPASFHQHVDFTLSACVMDFAAEAHGAEYRNKRIGTIGDMAAFSLYAAHIITSIEGGMMITNDGQLADIMRSLRNHGIEGKFQARRIGFSAKMNELEAAVGLANIELFDVILAKRRQNLLYLIEKFQQFEEYFFFIREEPHEKIGPHAFSIVLKETCPFSKEAFVRYLDEKGIDSRNLFYAIPTQCPSYAFLGHKLGDFPEAEYCSLHGTHIGIHQDIETGQLDYVVETVGQFIKSHT